MTRRWLFADQLGPHFALDNKKSDGALLVESRKALGRRVYHRQKLHLVLSALRHRAAELGENCVFLQVDTYQEALDQLGEPVVVYEPTSRAAANFVNAHPQVLRIDPTPGFTLPRNDFATWAGDRRQLRMDNFYQFQRKRLELLVEGDEPVGGRWSFDEENREPPPKGVASLDVPPPYRPSEDEIDQQVRRDLDEWERAGLITTIGVDGPRLFPVTRQEALAALQQFTEHRLGAFGPHEDAMLRGDWAMAHSLLSVPLNLGLLSPIEVAEAAVQAYRDGLAPLNSVEGFVRQIIGWREYVWQLYWFFGAEYRKRNQLSARTALPPWFAQLDADAVEAACLKDVLAGVRDRGWVHHIPRLMVLGNWAAQRGYDPDALTEWFQTAFVDGYDWVMPVNVVGMSQHADGGAMATKPYISGGAYLNKMSDYCAPCRYNPKIRVGDDACPFTAGYWAFLQRNRSRLEGNHRLAQPLRQMDRLVDLPELVIQERDRGSAAP